MTIDIYMVSKDLPEVCLLVTREGKETVIM